MFSNTVNSKPVALLLALFLWVLGAAGLQAGKWPVEVPVKALAAERLERLAGHGGGWAMVGGMRAVMAGACWLRANLAWERRDAAETTHWIELAVATDERPLTFWLNGARMLAYDLPEWRRDPAAPVAVQARMVEEHAQQALTFLETGLRWRGPDAALYVEMANLHWRRRGDLERAADYYRRAAEQPDAPAYAARIHGELLRALGRPREALAWLRALLPTLEEADPLARREVVVARIKELEAEVRERGEGTPPPS